MKELKLLFPCCLAMVLFLAACNEHSGVDTTKPEGRAQAVVTPITDSPANAGDEGDASASSDEVTTPSGPGELLLTPTSTDASTTTSASSAGGPPVGGSAPADSATTTTAAASNDPASPELAETEQEAEPVDLAQSPSPYLRLAAQSPVQWLPFSREAFERAAKENRPVLIDIGNLSNHYCRLMSTEVYAHDSIASTLNERFVCIKVDGDQQPDVQARYGLAHRIIHSKEPRYPLTVFALPDGRPFDVLSYVPREGTEEQPGMEDVLKQVQDLFRNNFEGLERQATLVAKNLEKLNEGDPAGSFDTSALKQLTAAIAKVEDLPHEAAPGAAMFLLHHASDTGEKAPLSKASDILLTKFRSATRDHVMGGYFQANEDGSPRFHKVLPLQAQLISANALAYAGTNKSLHKEAAQEVLRFCRDTLEARNGGFYASQDADTTPEDDGSYFTWTRDEILELAGSDAEARVFAQYLNAGNERAPLYVTDRLQGAADANGLSYNAADKALDNVRLKLRNARMEQENVPFVNKAILTGWNAEMICAYLDAFRYLGDEQAREFALQTADYLINHAVSEREGVARVIYKDQASGYGYLEDNVKLAAALMQCFQVSAQKEYLESAESLVNFVEARFLDPEAGLYRDSLHSGTSSAPGLLAVAHYPIADDNSLGTNAVAAQVWYQLYQALGNEKYQERARRIVDAAGALTGLEVPRAGTLGRAASLVVHGAPKVLIIGPEGEETTKEMHLAALPVFRMGKLVEVLTPEEAAKTEYPASKDGKAIVYVCTSKNCAPPVKDVSRLADVIKKFGRGTGDESSASTEENDTLAAKTESRDSQDVN